MRIAILIPTKGRPKQLKKRVNDLLLQPIPVGVELAVILSICNGDEPTWRAASDLYAMWGDSEDVMVWMVKRPSKSHAVDGWNRAHQAFKNMFDWFVLGADDIVWHTGWLDVVHVIASQGKAGVIGLSDGGHTDIENYAPHYMASAEFINDAMGGWFVPPVYQSWWFDREVCEIAQGKGVYVPAPAAVAEHTHPDWGNASMDETYQAAWGKHAEDRAVYMARRAAKFPPLAKEMA